MGSARTRSRRTRRLLPPLIFLVAAGMLALYVFPQLVHTPGKCSVEERKFWNCFVNWWGFAAVLSLLLVTGLRSAGAAKKIFHELSLTEIWVLFAAMALADVLVGQSYGSTFTHSMLWHRGMHDYLHQMGNNMFLSFRGMAIVMMLARPWRFVPSVGLCRTILLSVAIMLVNYIVAFMSYVVFYVAELE